MFYRLYSGYQEGSKEKYVSNTLIGAYGLTAVGTIPATFYFGVDAFYPGGWTGNDTDRELSWTFQE